MYIVVFTLKQQFVQDSLFQKQTVLGSETQTKISKFCFVQIVCLETSLLRLHVQLYSPTQSGGILKYLCPPPSLTCRYILFMYMIAGVQQLYVNIRMWPQNPFSFAILANKFIFSFSGKGNKAQITIFQFDLAKKKKGHIKQINNNLTFTV